MQRKLIDKANEIINLIEKNEKGIEELSQYMEKGGNLYSESNSPTCGYRRSVPIKFEDWEIRLMIRKKEERIKELKEELERL